MRSLHILGGTNRGGIETWLLRIMPALLAQGVRVDILVHGGDAGDYESRFRNLGCDILRCGDHRRPWRYIPRFLHLLREHGPYDIVHGQLFLLNGLHMHLAHLAGVPHRIAHMHPSSDVRSSAPLRTLYRRLMAHWIAADATCMMFPSRSSAKACAPLGDFSRLPHVLIPNCVDLSAFRQTVDRDAVRRSLGLPCDRPLIVYVGRFVAHKNHALLIDIADDLSRRGRTVHIALAGSHGDRLAGLEERVRGRSDISILVGLAEIAPLLQSAVAFVLPSLEEGFGVVAIEAQAAGLPVVASDLPAIREALAPTAQDLVFPANDAAAAAAQLDRLLGDDQLLRRMADDGRRFSERFSISASAEALVEAYRLLVERKSGLGSPSAPRAHLMG